MNEPVAATWTVRSVTGAVEIDVHVKPKSSRAGIVSGRGGAPSIAVRSPPVEGAANEEVCELLARVLAVRKSDVAIVRGASSRKKVVRVSGLSVADVLARLTAAS